MDAVSKADAQISTRRKRKLWMQSQPRSDSREEIRKHMSSLELETRPDKRGMTLQSEYRWRSRYNLVVFISKSHEDLELDSATLFLAVNILDRYSSRRLVKRCHRELLGGVALVVASKYINRSNAASSIRQAKRLFHGYDVSDVVHMEKIVLMTLDYLVGFPSVMGFMQVELLECEPLEMFQDMVFYICELTLFFPEFISKPSILIARTAVELSNRILGKSPEAGSAAGIGALEHQSLRRWMLKRLLRPPPLLFSKYARWEKFCVALTVQRYLQGCNLSR